MNRKYEDRRSRVPVTTDKEKNIMIIKVLRELENEKIVEFNDYKRNRTQKIYMNNSLENIIHQSSKIKLKTKRSKQNKVEFMYDSLNPKRIEFSPTAGGKIEVNTYARNLDSDDIISKTVLFDPYHLNKSENDLEVFMDEMNEHYASGTIDSIVRSLHDPTVNKYLARKTSTQFIDKFEKIRDIFSERYQIINPEMNSDVSRLIIHKNRRLPGYKTLKSGKKIMGLTSTLTLPSKLLAFGERFQ